MEVGRKTKLLYRLILCSRTEQVNFSLDGEKFTLLLQFILQKKSKWFLNFLIGNLRAYGGCLDSNEVMKDAAWRRYASGRCLATFDPEMSEWGNPSVYSDTVSVRYRIDPVK